MRKLFILPLLGLLSSCQSGSQTLASIAAKNNTTPAAVASAGAEFCGVADSETGQLAGDGLVMLAAVAGVPVDVTGLAGDVVAALCPKGTVPGPLPAGVDPTKVPAVAPTTTN